MVDRVVEAGLLQRVAEVLGVWGLDVTSVAWCTLTAFHAGPMADEQDSRFEVL